MTLDRHPRYHLSGGRAAGESNGNGIGGVWHVVAGGAATGPGWTGGPKTSTACGGPYGY